MASLGNEGVEVFVHRATPGRRREADAVEPQNAGLGRYIGLGIVRAQHGATAQKSRLV